MFRKVRRIEGEVRKIAGGQIMQCPDNYSQYLAYERSQIYEYEHYRQQYLEGEISEKEWEDIQDAYGDI